MNPLKRLLLAICWPFAKRRNHPRLVIDFRRNSELNGVCTRITAENLGTSYMYELKCMALFLYALHLGLNDRIAETGCKAPSIENASLEAYLFAFFLLHEAENLP